MKTLHKKIFSVILTLTLTIGTLVVPNYTKQAQASNTIDTAIPVKIVDIIPGTMNDEDDETYWYKLTIPNNIGKNGISIALNNQTDCIYPLFFYLYDDGLKELDNMSLHSGNTGRFAHSTSGGTDKASLTPGKTYFIKVYAKYHRKGSYTLVINKYALEKKNISKLSLSNYKKGSKKIVGKTIGDANVKAVVGGKTYTVKSNNSGAFTVTLKKKLKSKDKIEVTVSKTDYKTRKKSFRVK